MSVTVKIMAAATLFFVGTNASANCEINIGADDALQFSMQKIEVSADCEQVTVNLTHTGQLPAAAMGHNWVLSLSEDMQAIATDGMAAGLENNYVQTDDERVIAATKIIGGGETDSVTFDISGLDASKGYTFFCSFPGHWAIMKGDFLIL